MIKTGLYIIGALALHHTDLSANNSFFSVFLPILDMLFFIFIIMQIMFYFSLNNFSNGNNYNFKDLILDIYDLRYDIQDHGLMYALFHLTLNIIDLICIVVAVYYYSQIVLGVVSG